MSIAAILLIALLCLCWLVVIGASLMAEEARIIDNENNETKGNE